MKFRSGGYLRTHQTTTFPPVTGPAHEPHDIAVAMIHTRIATLRRLCY